MGISSVLSQTKTKRSRARFSSVKWNLQQILKFTEMSIKVMQNYRQRRTGLEQKADKSRHDTILNQYL